MWFALKPEARLSLPPGNGLLEQREPRLAAFSASDTVILALQLRRHLSILRKQPYSSVGLLKDLGTQLFEEAAEEPFP